MSMLKAMLGKKPDSPSSPLIPPPSYASRPPPNYTSRPLVQTIMEEPDEDEPQPSRPKRGDMPRHLEPKDSHDEQRPSRRPTQHSRRDDYDHQSRPRPPAERSHRGRYADEHDGTASDRGRARDSQALTRITPPSRRPGLGRYDRGRGGYYDEDNNDYDDHPRPYRGSLYSPNDHYGSRSVDPTKALVRAVHTIPNGAVTMIRGATDHQDIIAMARFSPVEYAALSKSQLEALMHVFGVSKDKVKAWCATGRIERNNGTQVLELRRVFDLYDKHYAARWAERLEEDRIGFTKMEKEKRKAAEEKRKEGLEKEERRRKKEEQRQREKKEARKEAKATASAAAATVVHQAAPVVIHGPPVYRRGYWSRYYDPLWY
ncbi:MAG: hypothetical protein Q9187_004448 [Circinaria calcarea]